MRSTFCGLNRALGLARIGGLIMSSSVSAAPFVSEAMVAAGLRVLHTSGWLDYESSADALLILDILEKALAVQESERKNSEVNPKGRRKFG